MSLSTLLPELREAIADELESRTDLLSLALVSSTFKRHIIPDRLRYHTVATNARNPALWAKLSSRPDLARNVRQLVLAHAEPGDFRTQSSSSFWSLHAADHKPHALPTAADTHGNDIDPELIAAAFRAMVRVRSVKLQVLNPIHLDFDELEGPAPLPIPVSFDVIELVAAHFPALTEFSMFTMLSEAGNALLRRPNHPVCILIALLLQLANLRSLHMEIASFDPPPSFLPLFEHMLSLSPDLEELHMPYCARLYSESESAFEGYHLPSLKRLCLQHLSAPLPTVEERMLHLLDSHPTIEGLCWSQYVPIQSEIRPKLPCIKHLVACNDNTLRILLADRAPRSAHLESITSLELNSGILPALRSVDPNTLRRVSLASVDSPSTLRAFAAQFPSLIAIALPGVGIRRERLATLLRTTLRLPLFGPDRWMARRYQHPSFAELMRLFPRAEVVDSVKCPGVIFEREESDAAVQRFLAKVRARYPRVRRVNGWRVR
ncbi:hypothetical protein OF83DRAFT_1178197 [Amylostereum chailletii]|nr:hypothetical protein OF83DRAFT_1178197 [Amylostereum chailletii]